MVTKKFQQCGPYCHNSNYQCNRHNFRNLLLVCCVPALCVLSSVQKSFVELLTKQHCMKECLTAIVVARNVGSEGSKLGLSEDLFFYDLTKRAVMLKEFPLR